MNEVGLIKVTMRQSEIEPIHRVLHANRFDDLLKSLHPAKEFWREPDFVTKDLNETPLAEIDLLSHYCTGEQARVALKLLQRERHGRVMFQRPVGNRQQPMLENSNLRVDRRRVVEKAE